MTRAREGRPPVGLGVSGAEMTREVSVEAGVGRLGAGEEAQWPGRGGLVPVASCSVPGSCV